MLLPKKINLNFINNENKNFNFILKIHTKNKKKALISFKIKRMSLIGFVEKLEIISYEEYKIPKNYNAKIFFISIINNNRENNIIKSILNDPESDEIKKYFDKYSNSFKFNNF
jgi:hypothetical protein